MGDRGEQYQGWCEMDFDYTNGLVWEVIADLGSDPHSDTVDNITSALMDDPAWLRVKGIRAAYKFIKAFIKAEYSSDL